MILAADVMAAIEEIAPVGLAEPWDNVGLMFGGRSWPVAHVLLALDPTPAVVAQAEGLQNAMIVTHHPLFFDPIRALVEDDPACHVVSALARTATALYSAHTNLDKSLTLGTPRALAEELGFTDLRPLAAAAGDEGIAGETASPGLGCLVVLLEPMRREALAACVGARLGAKAVQLVGLGDVMVHRLALVPGSGGDALAAARSAGADTMLTGELKHHEALEASLLGPGVIAAGHFETERPVLGVLQRYLRERLPGLNVSVVDESSPVCHVPAGNFGG